MVTPQDKKQNNKIIGRREWCCFSDLNIPAIKAKIDTGAKTSALHADHIEPFQKEGKSYIKFIVHPIQKNRDITCHCEAEVKDHRFITSSNGEREKRYVIETKFHIGDTAFIADITLTTRYSMTYRMLLGRDALVAGNFMIDVTKSYITGQQKNAKTLYR